jgi:hypothetical protein
VLLYRGAAKIISILQENPCLLRCFHEIRNTEYKNDIDPFYIAKHEYVRKRIIDAIRSSLPHLIQINSEYETSTGKIDVVVLPDKIILIYNSKIIGIEIKSGKSINLFQIERYLDEKDILLIVRVPTREVIAINSLPLRGVLAKNMNSISQKVEGIIANNKIKVPGDWCFGCPVECEFKKATRWTNSHPASLQGLDEYFKNVDAVTEKIISILKNEFKSSI